MIESKYIEAILSGASASRKTAVWNIYSKSKGEALGIIKWYGPWFIYVFCPLDRTYYSPSCIDWISGFIKEQMELRKRK